MLNWWWNRDRVLTHLHLTPLSWTSRDRDIIVAQSQSYISIIARAAKAKRRKKNATNRMGFFCAPFPSRLMKKNLERHKKKTKHLHRGSLLAEWRWREIYAASVVTDSNSCCTYSTLAFALGIALHKAALLRFSDYLEASREKNVHTNFLHRAFPIRRSQSGHWRWNLSDGDMRYLISSGRNDWLRQ